jgi:hypothetical protein
MLLGACATSTPAKPTTTHAVSLGAVVTDAAVGAGTDAGAYAQPSHMVQLGTVQGEAHFEGDVLVGNEHAYDPETLVPRTKPRLPANARTPDRYAEVAGGVGLVKGPDWPFPQSVTLEDTATKKTLRVVETCAAAGGPPPAFWLSKTGRFLICEGTRGGDSVFDSRSNGERDLSRGPKDLTLSPNDRYAISVPVPSWLTLEPTRTEVVYFDLDADTSKAIASAEPKVPTNVWRIDKNPFGVSFCGDGKLFALSLEREIVVYRGADGARLASAPAVDGRETSFDAACRYVSQTRGDPTTGRATTVFRLVL